MDSTEWEVSIELSPSSTNLRSLSGETHPTLRFASPEGRDLGTPGNESSDPPNVFTLSIESINKETNETAFTLKSRSHNGAPLEVHSSDRQLILGDHDGSILNNRQFVFKPRDEKDGVEHTTIPFIAADEKPLFHPQDSEEEIFPLLRLLGTSPTTEPIDQNLREQQAILAALAAPDEYVDISLRSAAPEDTPNYKPESHLDDKWELEKIKNMRGELDEVKSFLGEQLSSSELRHFEKSAIIVKVAKLLAIMSRSVYMRDLDFTDELREKTLPIRQQLQKWWNGDSSSINDSVLEIIKQINARGDKAREKIEKVAAAMGLKYQPLCNFSETGHLILNGPYCGAFYSDGKNPFIVVAFKGTGTKPDFVTDAKYAMRNASEFSPIIGQLHTGFVNGIFEDFPFGLRADGKMLDRGLPFQLMKNQLLKLESTILAKSFPLGGYRPQLWVTGHSLGAAYATTFWSGLLPAVNMKYTTMRDLITFGSPRVGNFKFSDTVRDIRTNRKAWRFVNGNDGVTGVPFTGLGQEEQYYHVDTFIKLSPECISLGVSELGNPPPHLGDAFYKQLKQFWGKLFWKITQNTGKWSDLVDFYRDHGMDMYWESLQKGASAISEPDWPVRGRGEGS